MLGCISSVVYMLITVAPFFLSALFKATSFVHTIASSEELLRIQLSGYSLLLLIPMLLFPFISTSAAFALLEYLPFPFAIPFISLSMPCDISILCPGNLSASLLKTSCFFDSPNIMELVSTITNLPVMPTFITIQVYYLYTGVSYKC